MKFRSVLPIHVRFWTKVRIEDPEACWLWGGTISNYGYGVFSLGRNRQVRAHRYSYEQLVGLIPEGLELDHLCRVRNCVNPAHLEPVTREENWRRGQTPTRLQSLQTHCKNGHELAGANLYAHKNQRICRTCRRAHHAAYRARKRAKREHA